jgi:hypothetical protein
MAENAPKDTSVETVENGPILGPIISCIGPEDGYEDPEHWEKLKESAVKISFGGHRSVIKQMQEAGFRISQYGYGFVPSDGSEVISSANKISEGYIFCTGIVGVGVDKETQENVSFLTHQDSQNVTVDPITRDEFEADLQKLLRTFKSQVVPGTADIMIYGGMWEAGQKDGAWKVAYRDVVYKLNGLIKEEMGIDPHIPVGPNMERMDQINVLIDTKHRRFLMQRPSQTIYAPHTRHNIGFQASELPQREKEWDVVK